MLSHVRAAVKEMAEYHIGMFGSRGGRGRCPRRPADGVPALIFDCDGVLADTERDGHRPAFNETFAEVGLPVQWSEEEYGEKLKIGGGKERMASLLTDEFVRANGLPTDADAQKELLADWHRRKTARYKAMVLAGRLPARAASPGSSTRRSGRLDARGGIDLGGGVGQSRARARGEHCERLRFAVFAGDIVAAKKPIRRSTTSPSSGSASARRTRS